MPNRCFFLTSSPAPSYLPPGTPLWCWGWFSGRAVRSSRCCRAWSTGLTGGLPSTRCTTPSSSAPPPAEPRPSPGSSPPPWWRTPGRCWGQPGGVGTASRPGKPPYWQNSSYFALGRLFALFELELKTRCFGGSIYTDAQCWQRFAILKKQTKKKVTYHLVRR